MACDPPGLRPPADLSPRPNVLLAQLSRAVGEPQAARVCAELLDGADPAGCPVSLCYVGGRAAPGLLAGQGDPLWARVWGARGLRYVWDEAATGAVVAGLADPAWRVAEMCAKVARLRDLGQAGDAVAALAGHELPRVRAAAVRALRDIGDTEHLRIVRSAREDRDEEVRALAGPALERMLVRLDTAPTAAD